jgi:dTDP-4-dehydrorhamnose reductase
MTAMDETSRSAFAGAVLEAAVRLSRASFWFAEATGGKPLVACRTVPTTTAEYPTLASSPDYSVLANPWLMKRFGFVLPDWRTQVHLAFASDGVSQHAVISA